jgi:hypothetical protein
VDPVQIVPGLHLPRFTLEQYKSAYCNVITNTGSGIAHVYCTLKQYKSAYCNVITNTGSGIAHVYCTLKQYRSAYCNVITNTGSGIAQVYPETIAEFLEPERSSYIWIRAPEKSWKGSL